jgi:hypothetical protein
MLLLAILLTNNPDVRSKNTGYYNVCYVPWNGDWEGGHEQESERD